MTTDTTYRIYHCEYRGLAYTDVGVRKTREEAEQAAALLVTGKPGHSAKVIEEKLLGYVFGDTKGHNNGEV